MTHYEDGTFKCRICGRQMPMTHESKTRPGKCTLCMGEDANRKVFKQKRKRKGKGGSNSR